MITLLGISFIYVLSIAWFSSFIDKNSWSTVLKFYSAGAIPLLIFIELIGIYLFISCSKAIIKYKDTNC